MFSEKPKLTWKYDISDRVRISKYKNIFAEGYFILAQLTRALQNNNFNNCI